MKKISLVFVGLFLGFLVVEAPLQLINRMREKKNEVWKQHFSLLGKVVFKVIGGYMNKKLGY